jgi:hypothetical protein
MILTLLGQFELIERDNQLNSYLLVIVLLGFAFVGIARVAQPDLIGQTFTSFFKMKRMENSGFDGSKLQPSMTALIMLNYLVSLTSCVFLTLFAENNVLSTFGISISVVAAISLIQTLNFRLVHILTGERQILETIKLINKQIWSFGGFIYLALTFFWILNQEHRAFFIDFFIFIFSLLFLWRVVKGIRSALQLRYKWYYLILYLCTLEILPLLILSKLAWHYFGVNELQIIR